MEPLRQLPHRDRGARQGRRLRKTIDGLRARLYLPVVSPKTGWLEEWMSPDNLGETTHRHLSPLIGLFPGDRIRPDELRAEGHPRRRDRPSHRARDEQLRLGQRLA